MTDYKINQQILPSGNFVFLDCETANNYNEICQIAAIIVQSGKIITIINEYSKPKHKFTYPHHTDKHGISAKTVKDANPFNIVWNEFFKKYVDDFVFVSHNFKSAEHNFLKSSLSIYNEELPEINYICTQDLTKRFISNLNSYTREYLVGYFNFKSIKNHDALSDACDCLNIFLKLNELYVFDYKEVSKSTLANSKSQTTPTGQHRKNRLTKAEKEQIVTNEIADKDFDGKRIVVTGEFSRFPGEKRKELLTIIEQRGGKTPSSVSSVTDMLVIGKDYGTGKYDKALSLGIKIVDEETLYKMLDNGNETLC